MSDPMHAPRKFMASAEFSEKALAKRIAADGFAAFSVELLPPELYSGNTYAPCIKHPAGFLTLRQAVDGDTRHIADIESWDRVILTIHDYRHEYLFYSATNAAILRGTIDAYRSMLEQRVAAAPRLMNRVSVAYVPKLGLMTVEAKQFNGKPDLIAVRTFVQTYLASESVAQNITDAFANGGMEASRLGLKSRTNTILERPMAAPQRRQAATQTAASVF
ncbi:hypothetical protein [Noviherbaspirillum pedocola]|uniref:Uncharacterized protein n=1 Tax=Noviherbaspirillum pedocola TaxID=2801341 RepID=A0A934W7Y9_9BURK|nr:hypothetical protein [Noviherbaspirillum pedocola]MBK4736183.1 hypothetical protein [Noviherbaspirillum pedocola]